VWAPRRAARRSYRSEQRKQEYAVMKQMKIKSVRISHLQAVLVVGNDQRIRSQQAEVHGPSVSGRVVASP
jgi:hypothetical protein